MYFYDMFAENVLKIFRHHVQEAFSGNMAAASRATGIHITTLEKWLKGTRDPGLGKIGPVMDMIGVKICLSTDTDRKQTSSSIPDNATKIIAELTRKLEEERSQKERLQGAVDVLRAELARLAPSPEKKTTKDTSSTGMIRLGSNKAV